MLAMLVAEEPVGLINNYFALSIRYTAVNWNMVPRGRPNVARPALVDSKVPRGKAAFHAILPALAFLVGGKAGPIIAGVTGALMALSVVGGPRFSVIGLLFKKVVRPAFKIGPGKPEEVAPHRFAEAIGAVMLLVAGAAGVAGAPPVIWKSISLLVAALAALNWLAGICVGCQMYLLFKRAGAGKVAA